MQNNRVRFILLRIIYKNTPDILYIEDLTIPLPEEMITIWQVKN